MEIMPNQIKSGMVAVSAAKPVALGQIGLNCFATICERMIFAYFRGWIAQKAFESDPTKSGLIRLNPAKKMAWISPARFKTGVEVCNP
jgi:hypothetical protein